MSKTFPRTSPVFSQIYPKLELSGRTTQDTSKVGKRIHLASS